MALLVVRAVLAHPDDRARFDHWYETEHLPDAIRAFNARRGWRCWSQTDPTVHFAFYEFADAGEVAAVASSAGLQALIAEFDRVWDGRVSRTREILELAGSAVPGTAAG